MKSKRETTNEFLSDANGINGNSRSSSKWKSCDEDADARYGCCGRHPPWLQPLNNIIGFIVFVSLANCMQSLAQGLYGVVLSTIERHFDLSSSASSWVASSYEIGQIPVLVVVSLLGTRSVVWFLDSGSLSPLCHIASSWMTCLLPFVVSRGRVCLVRQSLGSSETVQSLKHISV